MATLRDVRRRIKSLQSLGKVTKAMEIIASLKMRRAQIQAITSRPYDQKIRQVIADLMASYRDGPHPLMTRRTPVKGIAIVHLTSDRGLCGGINSKVNQLSASFILENGKNGRSVSVVCVGRKGRDFMWRNRQSIRAEFIGIKDPPGIMDVTPIGRVVIDDFSNGVVDEVYICYPRFVSTMVQKATMERLLPIEPTVFPRGQNVEYIFEPHPGYVLDALLPRFVEMVIYHALLETKASEHSARMVAMRNATDNANRLIDEFTLVLNKLRQETITKELLDIVGAAAAMGG